MIEWIIAAGLAYKAYEWLSGGSGSSSSGSSSSSSSSGGNTINVCGYPFRFVQTLNPLRDSYGNIALFYPDQEASYGRKHEDGEGPFCKFSINADSVPGVYLWVSNGSIIYIGRTDNFRRRFNSDYGNISPRNCYDGGQKQCCRMNHVALSYYLQGGSIDIYFCRTNDYVGVEANLLSQISTPYNRQY